MTFPEPDMILAWASLVLACNLSKTCSNQQAMLKITVLKLYRSKDFGTRGFIWSSETSFHIRLWLYFIVL